MPRKHLDNWSATLDAQALTGATTLNATPAPPDLAAGDYFYATIVDHLTAPGKMDKVKVTAAATGALTFEPPLTNDYLAGHFIEARPVSAMFDEDDGKTLINYTETEYTIPAGSGAVTVDRANGGIQSFAPTGDVTFSWSLPAGAKQQLYITPGVHVMTWGVDYHMGDVPDTTGVTEIMVVVENKGGLLYMWDGGSRT